MEDLNCTFKDYRKAVGFSGIGELAEANPAYNEFFRVVDGGVNLPTIGKIIRADMMLDRFVASAFEKFHDPTTRQFGENTFTIIRASSGYGVGHLERYCGPTLRMNVGYLRTRSAGHIVAVAHTHPYFRGPGTSGFNRDGAVFGPGDWVPLVVFGGPVYLYTPHRKVSVMEYDGSFVTVRDIKGVPRKWRVTLKQ